MEEFWSPLGLEHFKHKLIGFRREVKKDADNKEEPRREGDAREPQDATTGPESPDVESPDSFFHDDLKGLGSSSIEPGVAASYDPESDIGFDLSEKFRAVMTERHETSWGGYLSADAYDPDADLGFDLPPEMRRLLDSRKVQQSALDVSRRASVQRYQAVAKRKPRWAVEKFLHKSQKYGLLEEVSQPADPPYSSVGMVEVDMKDGSAVMVSCCRLALSNAEAKAIIGSEGVLSSAHGFEPLDDVLAAHVGFERADGSTLKFSVEKIGVPKSFQEAGEDKVRRYYSDYAVLTLKSLSGPKLSEAIPALPATINGTFIHPHKPITKVGYGRAVNGSTKMHKDEGSFYADTEFGKSFGSEGGCKRGMSGGYAMQGGRVIGIIAGGGGSEYDINAVSRLFLPELKRMVEKEPEWGKS